MFDLVSPVLLLRHLQERAQKAHLPVGLICPAEFTSYNGKLLEISKSQ